MQIAATGSRLCLCGDRDIGKLFGMVDMVFLCDYCFCIMYVCQSLPKCMIHSIVCVIHNKTVLLSPHVHPSWLLYPTQSVLPFCEGTQVCRQKSSEKSAIVNMRGRTLLWNAGPGDIRDLSWGLCDQPTLWSFILKTFGHYGEVVSSPRLLTLGEWPVRNVGFRAQGPLRGCLSSICQEYSCGEPCYLRQVWLARLLVSPRNCIPHTTTYPPAQILRIFLIRNKVFFVEETKRKYNLKNKGF